MGFSMLNPFCSSIIVVCPGVIAGAMISSTVGGTSGMFLVVTKTKSYGGRFSVCDIRDAVADCDTTKLSKH